MQLPCSKSPNILMMIMLLTFYIEKTLKTDIWKIMMMIFQIGKMNSSKPNILMMVADDLGYNDVSWHNQAVISPNLATLVSQGVNLENLYSQPTCSPTRAAFLTGRYPLRTGVHSVIFPDIPYGLNTSIPTLPQVLKTAGYSTFILGKWHLGFCKNSFLPTNRGFDHHYGFYCGAAGYKQHKRKNKFDFWDDTKVDWNAKGKHTTDLLQKRAEHIIKTQDKTKPFFIFLSFQSVHTPLQNPKHYKNLYKNVWNRKRKTYLKMVTKMDEAVGKVVSALKSSGVYNNTLIGFFSDNGGAVKQGANNWPLRGEKGTVWEGGTRVPGFVHGLGLVPRSVRSVMHVTDWFPTLLNVAGISGISRDVDGINQWPWLKKQSKENPRKSMVYDLKFDKKDGGLNAAVRINQWKFVLRTQGFKGRKCAPEQQISCKSSDSRGVVSEALFDLDNDPFEEDNVVEDNPQLVTKAKNMIKEYQKNMAIVYYPQSVHHSKNNSKLARWTTQWC